jgi:shikimate kinase/3-dehydroquinate synthase
VRIFLIGPPGVGKSAVARIVSRRLGMTLVDTDRRIEAMSGRTVPELFATEGEAAFRARESELLRQLPDDCVVATGGGTVTAPGAREILTAEGARTFALRAPLRTLVMRTARRPDARPLLAADPEGALRRILADRAPMYAWAEAEFSSFRSPRQVVSDLLPYLEATAAEGPRRPVAEGALRFLGSLVPGRAVIVTEPRVDALHGGAVRAALGRRGPVPVLRLPPGEAAKRPGAVIRLARAAVRRGIGRDVTVIAVGGGSLTDAAGLFAALYMRGVRWAVVPTTLLGMVDAALGGKVAVDLPEGKNLLGAFHVPVASVVDPALLATLSDADWREGLAEVIKAGMIADPELVEALAAAAAPRAGPPLVDLVRRARAVKIRVVAEDPEERLPGGRERLNLGHTFGHAVEQVSGYTISHGRAVAIGMAAAARLAEEEGLLARAAGDLLRRALVRQGLGSRIPGLPADALLEAMRRDKKNRDGQIRLVLPRAVGAVEVRPVDAGRIRQVLLRQGAVPARGGP